MHAFIGVGWSEAGRGRFFLGAFLVAVFPVLVEGRPLFGYKTAFV